MSKALEGKDLEILDNNIALRQRIINELTKQEDAFSNSRKIKLLLEALNSTDNTIIQKSRIKIDEEKNKNDSEIKAALIMSIREAHIRRQQNRIVNEQRETQLDDNISFDIKPTELLLHDEPRSVEEFKANIMKDE
jgi:hypothetical protein